MDSNNLLPPSRRFPKVPIQRRAYAFLLDFVTVWFISSFVSGIIKYLVFIVIWFALRVLLVEKNQGQSLGSWAFDMKVIDARFRRIPGLLELAKREGILGGTALLAMAGLSINVRNGLSMLLLISPLLINCGVALGDEEFSQAFHDRIASTLVIQTRRGFSLDLRLKKLWFLVRDKIRSRQDKY